jgi:hypothetical protein
LLVPRYLWCFNLWHERALLKTSEEEDDAEFGALDTPSPGAAPVDGPHDDDLD